MGAPAALELRVMSVPTDTLFREFSVRCIRLCRSRSWWINACGGPWHLNCVPCKFNHIRFRVHPQNCFSSFNRSSAWHLALHVFLSWCLSVAGSRIALRGCAKVFRTRSKKQNAKGSEMKHLSEVFRPKRRRTNATLELCSMHIQPH